MRCVSQISWAARNASLGGGVIHLHFLYDGILEIIMMHSELVHSIYLYPLKVHRRVVRLYKIKVEANVALNPLVVKMVVLRNNKQTETEM